MAFLFVLKYVLSTCKTLFLESCTASTTMFSLLIPYLAPFFDIFHPRHQITGGNITYIHSTHTPHAGRDRPNHHMKLHYSQTFMLIQIVYIVLNYHMKLHYSQTYNPESRGDKVLNYHMKLHYSQTVNCNSYRFSWLNYHMKLHYSQTYINIDVNIEQLNYHMKLHYSQTS